MIGNIADAGYDYEVHVYTGFKRNSGTKSKVYINIYGAASATGTRELTDIENRRVQFIFFTYNMFLVVCDYVLFSSVIF